MVWIYLLQNCYRVVLKKMKSYSTELEDHKKRVFISHRLQLDVPPKLIQGYILTLTAAILPLD